MRVFIIRATLKSVIILLGVLVISTGLQLTIRFHASEIIDIFMAGIHTQTREYFVKEFGLDRPFVPDLWPFDNESLWHRPKPEQRG
jgi:hypothetical protein